MKRIKKLLENLVIFFFDHYEADNQITFFVANDEKQYTLDEMTDILI